MSKEPFRATARVNARGEVWIPKVVREWLRLEHGDDVIFVEDELGLSVRRGPEAVRRAIEEWRGYLKDDPQLAGMTTDEIIEGMRGR